ncbi:MAG: serine/threonine protein kinase [Polyangiaceae bacterium]|nr:serine/threonine protein kinase [Polyangiaceae bacterium]
MYSRVVDPFDGTPYRGIGVLGQGGMGEVWEVEHEGVGTTLVAKVLLAQFAGDPGAVDRVRVEAQALAKLDHPNIVKVSDFRRTQDGRPFFVMERLDGRTAREALRAEGAFPPREAVALIRSVLSALQAAHALGLVHRDIKLDNVFLHQPPRGDIVVKVLDFGVAKVLSDRGPAPPVLPTAEGAVVGTPRYLSPEQVRGKNVDHRADIYGTGVLLYTLLCGHGPFNDVKRLEDLYEAQLTRVPDPPSTRAPNSLPPGLDAIVLRALEKNPDARFQSAKDFDAALSAVEKRWKDPVGFLPTEKSPAESAARSTRTAEAPMAPPEDRVTLSYVASAIAAVTASLVGFWLIGAHTPLGIAGTLMLSVVAGGACAMVLARR